MTTSFFARQTFVVEQHRKFFELRNQYAIFDDSGTKIGTLEQTKQSALALIARFGTDLDAMLPTTLELQDASGQPVLEMHKPWFKVTMSVFEPDGTPIGSIRKQIRVGKARFALTDPAGGELGEVKAQNWRAKDFTVFDQGGNEVASATKKWRGLATEVFTDADTYVVNMQPYASEPMRRLALAAALAIDIVMKEKD
jgi:uncharacterized protein YxjI